MEGGEGSDSGVLGRRKLGAWTPGRRCWGPEAPTLWGQRLGGPRPQWERDLGLQPGSGPGAEVLGAVQPQAGVRCWDGGAPQEAASLCTVLWPRRASVGVTGGLKLGR